MTAQVDFGDGTPVARPTTDVTIDVVDAGRDIEVTTAGVTVTRNVWQRLDPRTTVLAVFEVGVFESGVFV